MTTTRLRAPSARDLTAVLHAPAPPARPLAPAMRAAIESRLGAALARTGHRHRVDAFDVERAGPRFTTPFEWSARGARRVIGTAAARAWSARGIDPLTAAADEVDRLCDRAARGLCRQGSLGPWLASVPAPVRAVCVVESASWATSLIGIVGSRDPDARVALGVADAWHEVPGAPITLHGRRDAVAAATCDVERLSVLRLRDGAPGARAEVGLLVDGLVEALSAPERALPARVVGCWPDAGVSIVVTFDDDATRVAARAVVAAAVGLAATTQPTDQATAAA